MYMPLRPLYFWFFKRNLLALFLTLHRMLRNSLYLYSLYYKLRSFRIYLYLPYQWIF